MADICTKHKNWLEFQNETGLYEVEPLGRVIASWIKLSDVSDSQKARTLDFSELKGKKLYARFVRVNNKSYWKMYIVDYTNVSIVYVETSALDPIRLHKP
ncbi:MAG: hypothetical protein IJE68_05055 [Clostridia bacterium]|nr:hypothetical protein [Clostridia bacterium]